MNNGLGSFDSEMLRIKHSIEESSEKINDLLKSIKDSEETLSTLQSEGLVTEELELTFSRAIQESRDEIKKEESLQSEAMSLAVERIERAREVSDKEIAGVKNKPGGHATQVYHSLMERRASIDQWEKELQEAMETDNQ